jgi:hypothetical protein
MNRRPQPALFRHIARIVVAGMVATWALLDVFVPSASAQGCPDVEVTFARGTGEAPGVGPTGEAFVNALRSKVSPKSVGTYAVDYPATDNWPTGIDGIRDASSHVKSMAANCPRTKNVLGGFSQGAAVMGFVTSAEIPDGVDAADIPQPMSPDVANHVASVVLFGKPNERAMNFLGQPPVVIGPQYTSKTIELCANNDPVCSEGLEFAAHDSYAAADNGLVEKGAAFTANRL